MAHLPEDAGRALGSACEGHRAEPRRGFQSASWGLFQIMGFNHAAAGQSTPWTSAREIAASEGAQLKAFFLQQVQGAGRQTAIESWTAFARAYNGPDYAFNQYDTKLSAAYAAQGGR